MSSKFRSPKRRFAFAAITLTTLAGIGWMAWKAFDVQRRQARRELPALQEAGTAPVAASNFVGSGVADSSASSGSGGSRVAPVRDLRALLEAEARALGRPDSNPARTQHRLEKLVASLAPEQLHELSVHAVDLGKGGDFRFMSAYLLSLSRSPLALEHLEKIVSAPLPDFAPRSPALTQELVIRARALEGFERQDVAAVGRVETLVKTLSHPYLVDRAQRVLHSLRDSGRASASAARSAEEQDEAALSR